MLMLSIFGNEEYFIRISKWYCLFLFLFIYFLFIFYLFFFSLPLKLILVSSVAYEASFSATESARFWALHTHTHKKKRFLAYYFKLSKIMFCIKKLIKIFNCAYKVKDFTKSKLSTFCCTAKVIFIY